MSDSDAYAARSDVGRVRSGNEDRALAHPPLFAVADGMGGHRAGEVASELALSHLAATVGGEAAGGDVIARALRESNEAIRREARQRPALVGMGTTCTAAVIGVDIRIAHVGDSRAYLLRNGVLRQLTEDHSLVARMVGEGLIEPDSAEAKRVRHVITRALGADDDVKVDVVAVDRAEGDQLLLCTDGLHGQIDDTTIERALMEAPDPGTAAELLIALANDAGGDDNVTVIVINVDRLMASAMAPHPESGLWLHLPAWLRRDSGQ